MCFREKLYLEVCGKFNMQKKKNKYIIKGERNFRSNFKDKSCCPKRTCFRKRSRYDYSRDISVKIDLTKNDKIIFDRTCFCDLRNYFCL